MPRGKMGRKGNPSGESILAWDVSCGSFSGRQVLYERMFGGSPLRNAMTLFNTYDKEPFRKQVQNFLESDD